MKAAIIVIASVMAMAGPVFADEPDEINYKIRFIDSKSEKNQVLREFNLYDMKKTNKYKNDFFTTPKLAIEKEEVNNSYRKAN